MISYECFKLGEPSIYPGMDSIGRMVADLRTWEIVPDPDSGLPFSSLVPLRHGDDRSGLPYKWAHALGDEELAEGYIPATPRSAAGWIGVVQFFVESKNILLYKVMGDQHPDQNLAEIKFSFNKFEGGVIAEFAYGLLDKSQKGAGIVSNAFLVLKEVLPVLVGAYGTSLVGLRTTVSERNKASLRIIEKVGMERSLTQNYEDSPIAMGGKSISFEYYY